MHWCYAQHLAKHAIEMKRTAHCRFGDTFERKTAIDILAHGQDGPLDDVLVQLPGARATCVATNGAFRLHQITPLIGRLRMRPVEVTVWLMRMPEGPGVKSSEWELV